MSFLDRLRTASYFDPDGVEYPIILDAVTRAIDKKIGEYSIPQQDVDAFQDLGNGSTRFTVACYIAGLEYDKAADAFFAGLSKRHPDDNPGTLRHPRWGDISVKPLSFTQSEGLVDGMGVANFSIEFARVVVGAKFPTVAANAAETIRTASAATASSAVLDYIGPTTAADIAPVTRQAVEGIGSLRNGLASVAQVDDDIASALDQGCQIAVDTIDALVSAPATLAETVMGLVRLPSTVATSITQKVTAYATLFDSMVDAAGFASPAEDEFLSLELSASAIAAAEASLDGTLLTRADAVAASDTMAELLAYYLATMDRIDPTADTVRQVTDLLTQAQGCLLERSFALKSQRRKRLAAISDPLTVCFELYGTVDALPGFIADNDIADGEFYVLAMGREVVWYE